MCALFGVSRAAFYAWSRRSQAPDPDQGRMAQVQEAFQRSHQTYGYRRIALWLGVHQGIRINGKAVLRLMNKLGIRSMARRRRIYRHLEQGHGTNTYPNWLARDFQASAPNQKWVTDVTYIHTQQGWAYLSVIKDLFDGFIVAHQLSQNASIGLVTRTLQLARQKEPNVKGVLLHSDQGFQYRSDPYRVLMSRYGLIPSMSRRGNCWDNAPMENFFSHLKEEALRPARNPTFQEAQHIIDEYIHFFNYERIQLKTRQTPYQLRCLST
ncbi:MAG TPA: IS3 family transposase [Anaerolineales bacterium]